ncbi:MAG: hypothetical protein WC801_05200 [Patescibacteria group bacterium]|jgi:hypothetical protein
MQQTDRDPSNAELLLAIQGFANNNEQRLQKIETAVVFLQGFANYVQTNMVTKTEFNEVKQDVESLKQKADNTTTILDGIAKNVSTIQQDHVASIAWLQRHDENFKAHDKIIGHNCNFELAVGLSQGV